MLERQLAIGHIQPEQIAHAKETHQLADPLVTELAMLGKFMTVCDTRAKETWTWLTAKDPHAKRSWRPRFIETYKRSALREYIASGSADTYTPDAFYGDELQAILQTTAAERSVLEEQVPEWSDAKREMVLLQTAKDFKAFGGEDFLKEQVDQLDDQMIEKARKSARRQYILTNSWFVSTIGAAVGIGALAASKQQEILSSMDIDTNWKLAALFAAGRLSVVTMLAAKGYVVQRVADKTGVASDPVARHTQGQGAGAIKGFVKANIGVEGFFLGVSTAIGAVAASNGEPFAEAAILADAGACGASAFVYATEGAAGAGALGIQTRRQKNAHNKNQPPVSVKKFLH